MSHVVTIATEVRDAANVGAFDESVGEESLFRF